MGLVNRTAIKVEIQRLVNPDDRRGMPILAVSDAKTFVVTAQYESMSVDTGLQDQY